RAVRLERLRDDPDRVREVLRGRDDRLERPLRERPVADVTPLRAAHEARLPDRVGREVVVVHVAALLLEGEVVDALPLLRGAERERGEDLRLAAREQAEAVSTRVDADLDVDRADLLRTTPVETALLDRDLLADEVLVDPLRRALHVLLRERVLDRRLALGGRRADRERELDGLDDPLEQQVPLRGLQLLRVLLRLGQRAQVVLELLPYRDFDRGEALLLDDRREARANLQLPRDVLVGRLHRQRRRQLVHELLDDRAGLAQARASDALADLRGV